MATERRAYLGHEITLRVEPTREGLASATGGVPERPGLFIDDQPIDYGRLPNGSYFLNEYAYDWREDLLDLAQAFIDHRKSSEEIKRTAPSTEGAHGRS